MKRLMVREKVCVVEKIIVVAVVRAGKIDLVRINLTGVMEYRLKFSDAATLEIHFNSFARVDINHKVNYHIFFDISYSVIKPLVS